MPRHYAILQRWGEERQETLAFQFQNEGEAKRMYQAIRKQAKIDKSPVNYRLVELEGEMQYEGKDVVEARKAMGVKSILIQDGKIYDIMPDNTLRKSGDIAKRIE